jgi:uncharacterized circularly permuted ATP-grasp superfamily protein
LSSGVGSYALGPITWCATCSIFRGGAAGRVHRRRGGGLRPSYFNEIFDEAGTIRFSYEPLRGVYRNLGDEELARRIALAGQRLRELGATFPVDDGTGDLERLLPVDWVPRVIAADE